MDCGQLRLVLSSNLKKQRALTGLSQEKLAECASVSCQLIRDIEGKRTWVSDKTLIKLAKILNIEVYELLLPHAECEKVNPVLLSSDILKTLRGEIINDLDRRFAAVLTEDGGTCGQHSTI